MEVIGNVFQATAQELCDAINGVFEAEEETLAAKNAAVQAANNASSSALQAQNARNGAEAAATDADTYRAEAAASAENAADAASSAEAARAKVEDLICHHAIYDDIKDSSGENLLDSSSDDLMGQTLFADTTDLITLAAYVDSLEKRLSEKINALTDALNESRASAIAALEELQTAILGIDEDVAKLNTSALLDSAY